MAKDKTKQKIAEFENTLKKLPEDMQGRLMDIAYGMQMASAMIRKPANVPDTHD